MISFHYTRPVLEAASRQQVAGLKGAEALPAVLAALILLCLLQVLWHQALTPGTSPTTLPV